MNKISSIIERLREKPKEMRVQVSFLSALCVTGVVGLLWGVTLPTRLQGLPQGNQMAETEGGNGISAFFGDATSNLGQLIGATGEAQTAGAESEVSTPPSSDAYRVGAPTTEPAGYYDDPLKTKEPVVTPVNRREVRIGTTTDDGQVE